MAYMDQAKKSRIAAELAKVIPQGWKYSLAVRHHSGIVLTIRSAPVDLLGLMVDNAYKRDGYADMPCRNFAAAARAFLNVDLGLTVGKIAEALNLDNHDNSDVYRDYSDVGHYVSLRVGTWDKPFVNTAAQPANPAQPTQAAQPAQADKPASTAVPAQPESQANEIRTIDMTPTWGEWGNVYRRLAESGERAAVKHLASDFARAMASTAALQAIVKAGLTDAQAKILAETMAAELAKQGF